VEWIPKVVEVDTGCGGKSQSNDIIKSGKVQEVAGVVIVNSKVMSAIQP